MPSNPKPPQQPDPDGGRQSKPEKTEKPKPAK